MEIEYGENMCFNMFLIVGGVPIAVDYRNVFQWIQGTIYRDVFFNFFCSMNSTLS